MHAGAIERSPVFEMVAVCDIDPERIKQAKERFGCRTYEDYHEMLDKEELDLVSIVTRSDQHAEMTCDCLRAGVNVLVTKPWCVDEKEARRMIDVWGKSGRLLLPWLPARFGTDLTRLKEIVGSGMIGRVFYIRRGVYSFSTRDDWQTLKKHGGGYILNWGPHLVDQPLQLAGSRVGTVYGQAGLVMNPGDAEDWFMALLTLENGVRVQVEYNIALRGLPNWFIQGDRGTIIVNGTDITVCQAKAGKAADPTASQRVWAEPKIVQEKVGPAIYGDEDTIYAQVAMAVKGGKDFPVTPESALYLTQVLDAIKESAARETLVRL